MVHAHGIVGRDRAVEEGPLRFAFVATAQFFEGIDGLPKFEDGAFLSRKINLVANLIERHIETSRIDADAPNARAKDPGGVAFKTSSSLELFYKIPVHVPARGPLPVLRSCGHSFEM